MGSGIEIKGLRSKESFDRGKESLDRGKIRHPVKGVKGVRSKEHFDRGIAIQGVRNPLKGVSVKGARNPCIHQSSTGPREIHNQKGFGV